MYTLKLNPEEMAALTMALVIARQDYKRDPKLFEEDLNKIDTLFEKPKPQNTYLRGTEPWHKRTTSALSASRTRWRIS